MAKDGTQRGGRRRNSGPNKKALVDRIADGTQHKAVVMLEPAELEPTDLDSEANTPPPVKEFMKREQHNGELKAEEIFNETWKWLKARGCEKLVNQELLERYSMNVGRWIQCESLISDFGFLAKHPTTGGAIASPYVAMAQGYLKQIDAAWYQIYQIVKENCSVAWEGGTPRDDLMEKLLRARA